MDGSEDEVSQEEYEDDGSASEYECSERDTDGSDVSDAKSELHTPTNLSEEARRLLEFDPCDRKCIEGKGDLVEKFLSSWHNLNRQQRKQHVLSALATLVTEHANSNERLRFPYVLPVVGVVCRPMFCEMYGISTNTISRYRARVQDGSFHIQRHGNTGNKHAQIMDTEWLASWFRSFAKDVGEVVPVRVRRRETVEGRVRSTYTAANHLLLPSYFTWERLYEEMLLGVAVSMVRRAKPSEATFRQTVQKLCPEIRIRSPRDNVCDACVIYRNQMRTGNVTEIAELIGHHAAAAKAMRMEYKTDIEAASDRSLVLTMDYSQNIALPHVAETPSQWYFLSLIAVSVFGIHDANQQRQTNYIYTERKGGKGSNEVVSMLQRYLGVDPQHATLTVYADNCGGQNKNNYVIKYLLFLAHTGQFEEVNYKFFIRGHTKNACDRGFGAMKKKLAREDCWTVEQLCEALKKASISTDTVTLEQEEAPFLAYKDVFNELYKNLPAIQKYQLFKMTTSNPGVVECRESPSTPVFSFDLRREYDGVRVTPERARELFDSAEPVPQPTPNPEKIRDIHTSITPINASPHRKSIDFDALERAWEDGDDDRELRSPADDQFDRLNSASEEGARAMGPQMVFVTLDTTHEQLESLANRWKELLWNGGIEANIYEIEKNKVLVGVQKGSAVPDLRRFLDEQQEVQEYEWNGQRFSKRRTKTGRIHRTETTANEIPGSFNFSTNLIILHLLVHSLLQRLNNHIKDPNDCTWCDVANLHKNLMAQHLHVILVGEAQLQMSKQSCDVQLLGKYIKKSIQTRVCSFAQRKTIVHLVLEWAKVDDPLELNLSRLEKDRDYAFADNELNAA
ncbi:hypothetical protein P43SY_006054 [Pythium insidiosum]|uniref:DUF7869 domain-containing protein n=1 Tax=Pythium insidiosum TaxID=114742 RepID=A0AAD5LFZ8_PYTIN|nr:hypothetical protein P43SY_006054 [Pythium insidiosum]